MTITGSAVGREVVGYLKQATTWGTEATGGTGIYVLEDGLSSDQTMDPVEENDGIWGEEDDLGTKTAAFNIRQLFRFDDIRGIAMVLGDGSYATPAEQNAGKGDYLHTIYPSGDNNGDFATLAFQRGDSAASTQVMTAPSVKFAGFTLSGQASPNRVEVAYNTFADEITNASSTITDSSFDATTAPSGNGGRAWFRNLTFLVNDQSGSALSPTGDVIANAITSFEFSVQRSLAADYTNTSGLNIEEPVEDGVFEATLTLNLRNQDSTLDGFFTDYLAKTKKKLRFTITGNAASSATGTVATSKIQVDAPNAIIMPMDPASFSGPGRMSGSVTFKLRGAKTTSDAAGMAWVQPFRLLVINAQSAAQVS